MLQKASSFGRSVARVAAKPAALNPVGLGATMAMTPSIANAGENEFARQAKYGAKPAASTPATKQAAATPKTTTPAPGPQPKAPPPAPAAASAAASAPKPAAAPAAAPVKQTFGQAFAAARKAAGGAGGTFSYNSKQYQTNIKGEKYSKSPTPVDTAKPSVPTPPSRPAELSTPAPAASAPKPALSSPGVTSNIPKMTLPDKMGGSTDKNVYSVTDVTPKPASTPAPSVEKGGSSNPPVTSGNPTPSGGGAITQDAQKKQKTTQDAGTTFVSNKLAESVQVGDNKYRIV